MLQSLRKGFERALEYITIGLMISMATIVVVAVIYRKMGNSLVWYDEVASILLPWLTYYGAALAALKRSHLGFPGMVNACPSHIRVPLVILAEAIVIGFFVLLAWTGWVVLEILDQTYLVSLPEVSAQITQSVIPIGAVLFIIAELLSLPQLIREAREDIRTEQEPEGTRP
ncbi:MAG: TRAP transporter small permease [Alphaproteobacteria bacterium]|nr:TRAP transporter small permease [Alphaproteobacteria bacterium]MCZ6886162.1 TRAP transporter small permease [Alphaproteobacteria bacterium]